MESETEQQIEVILEEVQKPFKALRNNKTAYPREIVPEFIKYESSKLFHRLKRDSNERSIGNGPKPM